MAPSGATTPSMSWGTPASAVSIEAPTLQISDKRCRRKLGSCGLIQQGTFAGTRGISFYIMLICILTNWVVREGPYLDGLVVPPPRLLTCTSLSSM